MFLTLLLLAGITYLICTLFSKNSGEITETDKKPSVFLGSGGVHAATSVVEKIQVKSPEEMAFITERNGVTYLTLFGHEMLLVNKEYSLPSDFGGENAEATAALNTLYSAAANDGISLWTVSGYRSYETQESVYAGHVANKGQEEADKVSARPGHSEHQTGLAFDVNSLSSSFGSTPEGIWLEENMADYGFILRYPEGKTERTGYSYEPWHIRYVGVELAQKIHESGLTVEELIAQNSFSLFNE